MTPRARTFSQAPQAVRSARGRRRRNRIFPTAACAGRALHTDKCDALGLAADVHGLGNVSGSATARAVFRIHSSPSVAKESFINSGSLRHKVNPVTKTEQARFEPRRERSGRPGHGSSQNYFVSSPINTPNGLSEISPPWADEAPVPIRPLADANPLRFRSSVIFCGMFDIFNA